MTRHNGKYFCNQCGEVIESDDLVTKEIMHRYCEWIKTRFRQKIKHRCCNSFITSHFHSECWKKASMRVRKKDVGMHG